MDPSDRGVELTLDLDGLMSMEAARDILLALEDGVKAEGDPRGTRAVRVDRDQIKEIRRMLNEIDRGGAGFEFTVTAELRSTDADE